MNLAHIHLLLNHFPTIGTIIGIGLFPWLFPWLFLWLLLCQTSQGIYSIATHTK